MPFPPLALCQHLKDRHNVGVGVEEDGAQAGVRALPGQDQHHTALAHLWDEGRMSPGSRMETERLGPAGWSQKASAWEVSGCHPASHPFLHWEREQACLNPRSQTEPGCRCQTWLQFKGGKTNPASSPGARESPRTASAQQEGWPQPT